MPSTSCASRCDLAAETSADHASQHAVRLGLLLGEPYVLPEQASDDDWGHGAEDDRGERQVVRLWC